MQSGKLNDWSGTKHWLSLPLFALAISAEAAPVTPQAGSATTTYRVIQLSGGTGNAVINAKGQVAFTEILSGTSRAKFYDGRSVRDIGTLGGASARIADLNDAGQIAGTSSLRGTGQTLHAFRWSKESGMIDLAAAGTRNSSATDINSRGLVSGTAEFSYGTHAFRWSKGIGMWNQRSQHISSAGHALNDHSVLVGAAQPRGVENEKDAMTWSAWGVSPIGAFPTKYAASRDINNLGYIVGSAALRSGGKEVAFVAGTSIGRIDLGVPGPNRVSAERINEGGTVIGYSLAPGGARGFVWTRDQGLKMFGKAGVDRTSTTALNNLDQVVGGFNGRAFVWTRSEGVVDLNGRTYGAPSNLQLREAIAISDNGSIVATANNGLVLLVPTNQNQIPGTNPLKLTGTLRTNVTLSFSASIKDAEMRRAYKVVWSWGDGTQATRYIDEKTRSNLLAEQYAYSRNGSFTVKLSVIDSYFRNIVTMERKVVISPNGTFVDN